MSDYVKPLTLHKCNWGLTILVYLLYPY